MYVDVFPPTATVYTVTGLNPSTAYNFSVNALNTMGESSYADNNKILTVTTAGKFSSACLIKLSRHINQIIHHLGSDHGGFSCRFRYRLYFPLIWWAIHQSDRSHLICKAKITAESHANKPNDWTSTPISAPVCFLNAYFSLYFSRLREGEGEKSSDRGRETENKTVWCMINDDKLHSLCKHNEFCNCNVIAFDLQNKLVMSTGRWRKYRKHNMALPQSSLIVELTTLVI